MDQPKNTKDHSVIMLHAANGSSALNLAIADYRSLAEQLLLQLPKARLVLLAGPNELAKAQQLQRALVDTLAKNVVARVSVYHSNKGVESFANVLRDCQMFIAASTGTLHLAALYNLPTVAFFSPKASAGKLRWQPINDKKKQCNITTEIGDTCLHINVAQVAKKVVAHFLAHNPD